MDENKNTYQRLQALIKDESKSELFAAGGLFSGRRDDDHSALKLFGEYVYSRKTGNNGIPTTINSGDFISYLGLQLADKPEELKGLVEKIETLKKHGAITEQTLANNTFYNFAVILSDLDIVANPEKITSLYEAAFEEALNLAPVTPGEQAATSAAVTPAEKISPTPKADEAVTELTGSNLKPGSDAAVPGNVKGEGEIFSSSSTTVTPTTAPATPTPSSTTTTGTQTSISGAAGEIDISSQEPEPAEDKMEKLSPVTELTGSKDVPGNVNEIADEDKPGSTNQPSDQIPDQVHDQNKIGNLEKSTNSEGLEMEKLSPVTTDLQRAEGEQREFSGLEPERAKRAEAPSSEFQHPTAKATPRFRRFSQGGSQFRHLTGGANRIAQMPGEQPQAQQQRSEQSTQASQSEAESENPAQRNRTEQGIQGQRKSKKGSSLAEKLARLAAVGSAGGLTIPFLAPGPAAKAAVLGSSEFLQKIIAIIFS